MTAMDAYFQQVRRSLESFAAGRPGARVVIISDGKTPEQIRGIVDVAEDLGLSAVVESHADALRTLARAVSALSLPSVDPDGSLQGVMESLRSAACREQDVSMGRRRYEREQMKLRRRFSGRRFRK